ncbi:MAG TPA: diguanylate cyclase, partial [Synergistales bacterium]|nr:diguanylate cyclase [Synergistales bacterium]
IVLPETSGQTSTLKERINRSIYSWNQENNILTFPLTLSIGCAHWDPESPHSVEDILAEADKMMYQEKNAQRSEEKPYMRLVHDTDKLGTYRRIVPPQSHNN